MKKLVRAFERSIHYRRARMLVVGLMVLSFLTVAYAGTKTSKTSTANHKVATGYYMKATFKTELNYTSVLGQYVSGNAIASSDGNWNNGSGSETDLKYFDLAIPYGVITFKFTDGTYFTKSSEFSTDWTETASSYYPKLKANYVEIYKPRLWDSISKKAVAYATNQDYENNRIVSKK